jgi:hypothetical protein
MKRFSYTGVPITFRSFDAKFDSSWPNVKRPQQPSYFLGCPKLILRSRPRPVRNFRELLDEIAGSNSIGAMLTKDPIDVLQKRSARFRTEVSLFN